MSDGDSGASTDPAYPDPETQHRLADDCRHCPALVYPRVVVPTGKHATESVLTLEGNSIDGFIEQVLEPVDCPDLGVRVVPVLHPSYQNVWLPEIEHTVASYRAAIADLLAGR